MKKSFKQRFPIIDKSSLFSVCGFLDTPCRNQSMDLLSKSIDRFIHNDHIDFNGLTQSFHFNGFPCCLNPFPAEVPVPIFLFRYSDINNKNNIWFFVLRRYKMGLLAINGLIQLLREFYPSKQIHAQIQQHNH